MKRKSKSCQYGRLERGPRKGQCRKVPKGYGHGRFHGASSFGADFQRRHYVEIARVLKDNGCTGAVDDFVRMFQADNPRFNPSLFRKAAGG